MNICDVNLRLLVNPPLQELRSIGHDITSSILTQIIVHIFDILIFYRAIVANLGLTRGWPETGFFREYFVVIRRFGEKPGFFVGFTPSHQANC
ncbi:hypothetical protein QUB60_23760 [Microcoleus sp. A2-C5]|uniref:hypothetical protein n=1 Tax=unclassified Microcoleus TaxID=2642155 RepID=UPI002FCF0BDD